jgi:uncharacterized protein YpbB
MATNPLPEPVDPIDDEAERFFAHPVVVAAIEEVLAEEASGNVEPGYTSEQVAAELGLELTDLD